MTEHHSNFKVGNEFLPFHHQASHVTPDWRDGWNACYQAAIASRDPLYRATSKLMAQLGAFGEITTRSPLADDVMNALHDIDGGVYQPPKD